MSKDNPRQVPEVWPAEGHPEGTGLEAELYAANRAYQRAVDQMDETATAYLGINRSDGRCLDVLEERGPITAGELAATTGLSPGAITSLVDRLAGEGLVRRAPDPDDRRRVRIELTDAARQAIAETYYPMAADGEPWIRARTDKELRLLRDFLEIGAEINLKNAERVRALPPRSQARRRGHPRRETAG
jgi:DNA-binding MarR family transcriptional regulator